MLGCGRQVLITSPEDNAASLVPLAEARRHHGGLCKDPRIRYKSEIRPLINDKFEQETTMLMVDRESRCEAPTRTGQTARHRIDQGYLADRAIGWVYPSKANRHHHYEKRPTKAAIV